MVGSHYYYFVGLFLILELFCQSTLANEVTIVAPKVIDVRETATIACHYDIGFHRINSVKWWKDGKEFYRFTPFSIPNEARMTVRGVKISDKQELVCNEKVCRIHLQDLQAASSGVYKCEIAGDAPNFKVIQNQANMTVLVLPKRDPTIVGLSSTVYKIGDLVSANCTSDISSLPTTLQWFVDDQKASANHQKSPHQISNPIEGYVLHYNTVELKMKIDRSRFQGKSQIKFQCVAKIDRLPIGSVIKETTTYINVAKDNLKNQKLTDEYTQNGASVVESFSRIVILVVLAFIAYH